MAEKITKQIVEEVKVSKYFSISVDSTPDVSHVDQLSFIVRYISKDGTPIERFLKFIANTGHKSEQLADAVFDTFNQYNLDIKNCRGQSYDNASNMAGKCTGLQARIKEVIPLAIYVPCSAHSLNHVGKSAVDCCEKESFINECLHLRDHLFFKSDKKRNAQELCKMLYTNDLIDIYPNVTTALRMYLCTFATNCTAERSFSALKRVKSHLRSTLESDRLNATSILHIESEMLRSINYDDIIDDFASKKVRHKML